jgi:hypothetical protein
MANLIGIGRPAARFFLAGMALALTVSPAALAQIQLVRATTCGPGPFSATRCSIPATGAGNLIVIGFASGTGTQPLIRTVIDNGGNTYVQVPGARSVYSTTLAKEIWYAKNSRPGATSITISPFPDGGNGAAVIWEFSGADADSPLDRAAVLDTQPPATSPVGASVTTTTPGSLVVTILGSLGSLAGLAPGSAFSADALFFGAGWAHRIAGGPGAYAAQWSTTLDGHHSVTASFKAAATASSANPCDINRDGVVNIADVQRVANMSNQIEPCTANINGPGVCNQTTVNRVVNAALGQACVVDSGDSTPPSVFLTAPAAGSIVSGTVSVSASATDGGGMAGVQFFLDGSALGAEVAGPGPVYTTNWNTVSASNGSHFLTARARDTSSNFATSSAVSVTVSNGVIPPPAPKTVTLNWTASATPGVTYNIYRGTVSGGPYLTKVNSSPITGTSFTDTSVVSGQTYYYVARAEDASGTESVNSNQAVAVVP